MKTSGSEKEARWGLEMHGSRGAEDGEDRLVVSSFWKVSQGAFSLYLCLSLSLSSLPVCLFLFLLTLF